MCMHFFENSLFKNYLQNEANTVSNKSNYYLFLIIQTHTCILNFSKSNYFVMSSP